MKGPNNLLKYPRERAVEMTRFEAGLRPTRLVACMVPVWQVEVEATVTVGRPFDLIDRFIEEAIAEAGLATVPELALFFSLDETLVDRALRFLERIGHIEAHGGRYRTTELGRRSIDEGKRYEVTNADRRLLYFEALSSQPLTRGYYDPETVTFFDEAEVEQYLHPKKGIRFQRLAYLAGRSSEALELLSSKTDRNRYNLPEGLDDPVAIGSDTLLYFPVYLVRAEPAAGGPARYAAFTQTGEEADPELSEILEQHEFVRSHMEDLESQGVAGGDAKSIEMWLGYRSLEDVPDIENTDGTWRVRFSEREFTRPGGLMIDRIGRYVVARDTAFQLWCDSPHARTRALFDRARTYLASTRMTGAAQIESTLNGFASQLELEPMSLDAFAALAANAGHADLAEELGELH